jgi:hypothetical protein
MVHHITAVTSASADKWMFVARCGRTHRVEFASKRSVLRSHRPAQPASACRTSAREEGRLARMSMAHRWHRSAQAYGHHRARRAVLRAVDCQE